MYVKYLVELAYGSEQNIVTGGCGQARTYGSEQKIVTALCSLYDITPSGGGGLKKPKTLYKSYVRMGGGSEKKL